MASAGALVTCTKLSALLRLLLTQHGVLLPWSRGHLSAAATRILAITDMEAQLGAIFDPREVGWVVRGREVPVSLQQWLAHWVAHIHRAGPGNQPGIVLALLYRLDAARVRELTLGGRARLAAGTGGGEETWLREHPGTKANLKDFEQDLLAMARWRHPPSLFLTFSTNVGTPDLLGPRRGGGEGGGAGVGGGGREGAPGGRGGGGGVVLGAPVVRRGAGHLPPPSPHYSRIPMEAWRHRFVSFPLKGSH